MYFLRLNQQDTGMFASSGGETYKKVASKSISTTNGGQFAMTHGVRPTHKSSADNSALVLRHPLLVALISAKDPGGSYSMMSLVLVARHHWPRVLILEWVPITVDIPKTLALCVVQVRQIGVRTSVGNREHLSTTLHVMT